jgi:mono/diheme cytochrome c family protein
MKKIALFIAFFVLIAVTVGLSYIKLALPNVGDVPKSVAPDNDQALIKHGEYLANHVMVCMDCHSKRDWTKFSGTLVAGSLGQGGEVFNEQFGFPGTFTSKNITPTNLAEWSDGEIFRAITCGVNKNGEPLFPVMPYLRYGEADAKDISAVIAYLRTLQPIENKVAASKANFPMNFIIHTIPQKATMGTRPDTTNLVEYGKYLTNIAACGECHTKQEKGKPVEGMEFAGGFEFPLPDFGTCRSANITSDVTGIGGWSEAAFIRRFKAYADSSYQAPTVQKGYFNTVMPWTMYAGMTETDLKAIYHYLKSLKPINNKVEHFTSNLASN